MKFKKMLLTGHVVRVCMWYLLPHTHTDYTPKNTCIILYDHYQSEASMQQVIRIEFSVLVCQTLFHWETSGGVKKC